MTWKPFPLVEAAGDGVGEEFHPHQSRDSRFVEYCTQIAQQAGLEDSTEQVRAWKRWHQGSERRPIATLGIDWEDLAVKAAELRTRFPSAIALHDVETSYFEPFMPAFIRFDDGLILISKATTTSFQETQGNDHYQALSRSVRASLDFEEWLAVLQMVDFPEVKCSPKLLGAHCKAASTCNARYPWNTYPPIPCAFGSVLGLLDGSHEPFRTWERNLEKSDTKDSPNMRG